MIDYLHVGDRVIGFDIEGDRLSGKGLKKGGMGALTIQGGYRGGRDS